MRSEVPRIRAAAWIGAALVGLAGCSVTPDEDSPVVAYKEADSVRSLEVPPDLTRPGSSEAVEVPGESASGEDSTAGTLLPEFEGIRYVRAGVNAWLEVENARPEVLWRRIDGFLGSQGLTVVRSERSIGIVETGWATRQDAPSQGGIGGFFNGILGFLSSSGIRDKYQVRLERMDNGVGTRLFLTHWSAREVETTSRGLDVSEYGWAYGGGDPAIEAEMTRRLLVYLGVSERRAGGILADSVDALGAVPRYVVEGGAARLMIDDSDLRRVFARVGDALGTMGADVRAADAGRGRYVLEWQPPESVAESDGGFLGLFGDDEVEPVELQLQLRPDDGAVRVKAADAQGVPRSGAVHRALLRRVAVALGADPASVRQAEEAEEATGPDRSRSRHPVGPGQ